MSKRRDDILGIAAKLAAAERAELAVALLAGLDSDHDEAVEAAWAAEIERRIERVETGEATGRPWSAVREGLTRRRE